MFFNGIGLFFWRVRRTAPPPIFFKIKSGFCYVKTFSFDTSYKFFLYQNVYQLLANLCVFFINFCWSSLVNSPRNRTRLLI